MFPLAFAIGDDGGLGEEHRLTEELFNDSDGDRVRHPGARKPLDREAEKAPAAVDDRPFDLFPQGTPVCVELLETAECLTTFVRPPNPVYVFGPEDGSVPPVIRRHCHKFVYIPAYHCLNPSAAVDVVLYDRMAKRQISGEELMLPISEMLHEDRGVSEVLSKVGWEGE